MWGRKLKRIVRGLQIRQMQIRQKALPWVPLL